MNQLPSVVAASAAQVAASAAQLGHLSSQRLPAINSFEMTTDKPSSAGLFIFCDRFIWQGRFGQVLLVCLHACCTWAASVIPFSAVCLIHPQAVKEQSHHWSVLVGACQCPSRGAECIIEFRFFVIEPAEPIWLLRRSPGILIAE